jgi:hypothetical protein
MTDDSGPVQLYNEEDNQIIHFIEYKRLSVQGRIYALLQPEDDMDQLVAFRVEETNEDEEEEIYIYVVDPGEFVWKIQIRFRRKKRSPRP